MREQEAARDAARSIRELYRGGLARRLRRRAVDDDAHLRRRRARQRGVAVSCSTGSGSGVVVPGHGHPSLNNMLGELDLAGLHRPGSG